MATNIHIDETSCGPFCQHPYCWYSNRRLERGLPMTKGDTENERPVETQNDLPTLKVFNMIEDYGFDPNDQCQSQHPIPTLRLSHSKDETEHVIRSSSAPEERSAVHWDGDDSSRQAALIPGPHPSAVGLRNSSPSPSPRQPRSNKPAPAHAAPYSQCSRPVTKVDMRPSLDTGLLKHQGITHNSRVYIWCPPPQEQGTSDPIKSQEISSSGTTAPRKVHSKDMTGELLPETMVTHQGKARRAKKKHPNNQTPTGGRPYTHPARMPPPLTRRTLPQDLDDGISQLLQLPRDVLLELLEHTRESDLYDKKKVALLLEKLMPLVRFDKEDAPPPHHPPSPLSMQLSLPATVPAPPLHSSGILLQKKVTLLDSHRRRPDVRDPIRAPPPTCGMPFVLDEAARSGIAISTHTKRERPDPGDEDRDTTAVSPTVVSEEPMKRRPLGPIRMAPTELSSYSRHKVTSVSAKSLPPLQPGIWTTRPFNYASQSVDFALSPLTTPDIEASEKMSSPYSGRASTVYATVATQLTDRTPPASPASCECTPVPPITRQSSAHYSMMSSASSDDFNAIRGSKVLRVPYGVSAHPKEEIVEREVLPTIPPKWVEQADHEQQLNVAPSTSPVPVPSVDPRTHPRGDVPGQERPVTTTTSQTREASTFVLPSRPIESTTPYDDTTSVMAQASDKAAGSPMALVTPLPPTETPEVWPVVDEREFMKSPECKIERFSTKKMEMILAPVAPPPSPEPDVEVDYDIQEVANKSATTSSLTPLVEEEEEEGDVTREDIQSPEDRALARTGTRSRGYLGDDEDCNDDDKCLERTPSTADYTAEPEPVPASTEQDHPPTAENIQSNGDKPCLDSVGQSTPCTTLESGTNADDPHPAE